LVYIKTISKNLWPGYTPPFNDELFSSWLFRLSKEHRIKTFSFCKEKLHGIPIWNRDIDMFPTKSLLQIFNQHTIISNKAFYNLFLSSYEGIIFEKINLKGKTSGVLPIGVYHRKRKRNGLLYCPNCFKKGNLYFKKTWRLTTSIVCTDCLCLLYDRCPECSAPIIFHRLDIGKKSILDVPNITYCFNCNFNLAKTDIIKANNFYLEYQKFINKTIKFGYNEVCNYSFQYFKVIFKLCSLFSTTSEKWIKFKTYYEQTRKNSNLNLSKEFVYLTFEERSNLLIESYKLLKNWPNNFINFCLLNDINYTDFWRDKRDLPPYFIYKVLKLDT